MIDNISLKSSLEQSKKSGQRKIIMDVWTHIINQTSAVHVNTHPISPASKGARVVSSSCRTIMSVPYGLIVASEAAFEGEEMRP